MRTPDAGGGWAAVLYSLARARESGGLLAMWRALRSRNACKTCALGMGGQRGGMVNEAGRFPEVCKKSIQAMAADMQGRVREDFFDRFSIPELQRFSPRELEHAGRLVEPVLCDLSVPGEKRYRPVSWDAAFDLIAEQLRAADPDDTFTYFSGRSSNEAAFLAQVFARLYGTNNVSNCSYYCHQASGVALGAVTGSGAGTVTLEDVDHADLVFLVGANPASNHPRFMRSLVDLRRRRGAVVVVNPLRELGLVRFRVPSDPISLLFGSDIASEYVQPNIGGDVAFFFALAKRVDELGGVDEEFLHEHCEGGDAFRAKLRSLDWRTLNEASGVPFEQVERIAEMTLASRATIFAWAMGLTHHEHGVQNIHAVTNLALLRGMIGRPGAGLLPLRGHSNIQGVGSMGVVPQLRGSVLAALERELNFTAPAKPGLDTLASLERAHEKPYRFVLAIGGNLFGASPDAEWTRRALANTGLVVYMSTTLNTGHAHGLGKRTLILPVLARDEEPQPTTQESMFSYVRLSEGGPRRHEGPRSEVDVVCSIAERVLGDRPLDWRAMRDHANIRALIAKIVPGYEPIARIDAEKREFHVGGRRFDTPRFATPSGRAVLHTFDPPPLKGPRAGDPNSNGLLRVMTLRSEGQFNTVVYDEDDRYRGQERRDVILMNERDMARLRIAPGERITVRTAAGEMSVLARAFDLPPGNAAMYYPEANTLVPRDADSRSRTPSFKSFEARVGKQRSLPIL